MGDTCSSRLVIGLPLILQFSRDLSCCTKQAKNISKTFEKFMAIEEANAVCVC